MAAGTPPRAWGRAVDYFVLRASLGNTPTGVGKSVSPLRRAVMMSGTPPRAWGRAKAVFLAAAFAGNTPTGVGKRKLVRERMCSGWEHPHGRGEESVILLVFLGMSRCAFPGGKRHRRTARSAENGLTARVAPPSGIFVADELQAFKKHDFPFRIASAMNAIPRSMGNFLENQEAAF